jgi:hypothetical protein
MEDGSARTPLKGRARLKRTRSMVTMMQNSSKACQILALPFSEHYSTFNQIETRLYTVGNLIRNSFLSPRMLNWFFCLILFKDFHEMRCILPSETEHIESTTQRWTENIYVFVGLPLGSLNKLPFFWEQNYPWIFSSVNTTWQVFFQRDSVTRLRERL